MLVVMLYLWSSASTPSQRSRNSMLSGEFVRSGAAGLDDDGDDGFEKLGERGWNRPRTQRPLSH